MRRAVVGAIRPGRERRRPARAPRPAVGRPRRRRLHRRSSRSTGAAEALGDARTAGVRVIFLTNNASRPPRRWPSSSATSGMPAARRRGHDLGDGRGAAAGGRPPSPGHLFSWSVAMASRPPCRVSASARSCGPRTIPRRCCRASRRTSAGARSPRPPSRCAPALAGSPPTPTDPALAARPAAGQRVAGRRPRRPRPGCSRRSSANPQPALYLEARRRRGQRPLGIGDRLDTDIEGARAAGLPSLLVLSGVSTACRPARAPLRRAPATTSGVTSCASSLQHPASRSPTERPDAARARRAGDRRRCSPRRAAAARRNGGRARRPPRTLRAGLVRGSAAAGAGGNDVSSSSRHLGSLTGRLGPGANREPPAAGGQNTPSSDRSRSMSRIGADTWTRPRSQAPRMSSSPVGERDQVVAVRARSGCPRLARPGPASCAARRRGRRSRRPAR